MAQQTFTGRKRVRKFFGHIREVAEMPNLIEVQKASYDQFLQVDEPKGGRPDEGLQSVFKSVFPISDFRENSSLEFIEYSIGNWECKCGKLAGLHHLRKPCSNCGATLVADPYGRFDPPVFSGDLYDADRAPGADLSTVVRYYDVRFPRPSVEQPAAYLTGGIIARHGGETPDVVVLGSSHALMYGRVIDDLCRARGLTVAFLSTERRSLFFENDAPFDDARRRWLAAWRPSLVIADAIGGLARLPVRRAARARPAAAPRR